MEYLAIAKFYKEQNAIFKANNVKKEKKVKKISIFFDVFGV